MAKKVKFMAVTSGKGGVGKSTVSSNLAQNLSKMGYKVAVFDADIGLANLDIMFNLNAKRNISDVMTGKCKMEEIVIEINKNLFLIPGLNGEKILKFSVDDIIKTFSSDDSMFKNFDVFIIDTGAGITENVIKFLEKVDEVLLITTPEPTSISDFYSTMKILSKTRKNVNVALNMAVNKKDSDFIFSKIQDLSSKYIGDHFKIEFLGSIHHNVKIFTANRNRKLFSKEYPRINSSKDMKKISITMADVLGLRILDEERSFLDKLLRR